MECRNCSYHPDFRSALLRQKRGTTGRRNGAKSSEDSTIVQPPTSEDMGQLQAPAESVLVPESYRAIRWQHLSGNYGS
jgi:hypothetical protein